MTERAAKCSAPELHDLDVGSLDRLMQAFEAVQVAGIDRDVPVHHPPPLRKRSHELSPARSRHNPDATTTNFVRRNKLPTGDVAFGALGDLLNRRSSIFIDFSARTACTRSMD
jgi:hypothetical protein